MAKIERFEKISGYHWQVVDRFKTRHFFATYREALAFCLM